LSPQQHINIACLRSDQFHFLNITYFILDFANQLADYSTAYEHRQYIGLLEKLQQFSKK
jgi:hypothetical protein